MGGRSKLGAGVQEKSVRADGKSEFRSHELGSHFFWVRGLGLSVNQNFPGAKE